MKMYHDRIKNYLMERPGKYIELNEMVKAFGMKAYDWEAFYRAIEDLIACGRIVKNESKVKINQ